MTLTAGIEQITPDQAFLILTERNPRNRNLRPQHVERYAEAMRRGEWQLNGETLKFDTRENLIDGQHRLAAVVEAGAPQRFMVVRGLAPETQDTVDDGSARTHGDVLAIHGERNANVLASAARNIYAYELIGIPIAHELPQMSRPTKQQILTVLDRHPDMRAATNKKGILVLSGSQVSTLRYLFRTVNAEQADEFLALLHSGEGLASDDPVLALRNRLIASQMATSRLPAKLVVGYTIRGFNAWRRGERLQRLQWGRDRGPEWFPRIEGCPISVRGL